MLHISIPTVFLASSFQSYCLFRNNCCPFVGSEKFCLPDINSKFRIIAMSEIVDCQILFYTQCVVIVTIRLHSALGLLSSNHSLDTATVVRAKEDFYIRAIILSCVLQKCFFNPNVVFFSYYYYASFHGPERGGCCVAAVSKVGTSEMLPLLITGNVNIQRKSVLQCHI